MRFVIYAHKSQGVIFNGKPDYIQQDAYLDPSGGLIIEKRCRNLNQSHHPHS